MGENKTCNALIKPIEIKQKDVLFEVIAVINLKGYDCGSSPNDSVVAGQKINVDKSSIDDPLKRTLGNDWKTKKDIIEANVSITEDRVPFSKHNNKDKRYELSEIKRTRYLYDTKWISETENKFIATPKQIKSQLQNHNLIPIDLSVDLMFDEIKQIDDIIYPAQTNSTKLKIYTITRDSRFIAIPQKEGEFCITEKAFQDLRKTAVEIDRTVELLGRNDLLEWLSNKLLKAEKEKTLLLQDLEKSSFEKETQFHDRIERCKAVFKENTFSKQDLIFFQKKMKPDELAKAWNCILETKNKEAEKLIAEEKKNKIAQIDEEVKEYRDAAIFSKIEAQEKRLESLTTEIKEKELRISTLSETLIAKTEELSKMNSDVQAKIVEMESINEQKLKVIYELEEHKEKLLATLEEALLTKKTNTAYEPTINTQQEFYPARQDSLALEEDEDLYKIISTTLDVKLKKDLTAPVHHLASIIPDLSYAYVLAHFVGNCHLKVITIEHEWYHFEDFKKAGLVAFWNEALSNPKENYLLVLQNMNMIPICCALQPLIDIIKGSRISLPESSENKIPENIRILGTVLPSIEKEDIGLPLDETSFCNFQFVGDPKDTLPIPLSELIRATPKRCIKFSSLELKKELDHEGFRRYTSY